MKKDRLLDLLDKIQKNTATEGEIQELNCFYDEFHQKKGYIDHLDPAQKTTYREKLFDRIYAQITENNNIISLKYRKRLLAQIGVAASVLLCLGLSLYFYMERSGNLDVVQQKNRATTKISTMPQNQPILTLSNGEKISLSDMEVGAISDDNGVSICKTADGELVYTDNSKASEQPTMNLIEIPKGKRYQVQLPDRTKVWLNATSSLRYPSSFQGDKREVELVGEAYFEVARNNRKPFLVHTARQTVEVLGTHFNVNSYTDEKLTKTTLLEGSVKVIHQDQSIILKPGQQAATKDEKSNIVITTIDTDHALAWKNGSFLFEDADIRFIMRHLARQYDIEVVYQGDIPSQRFGGAFQESAALAELLEYLESYGDVHFKIEGRRVTVME